MGQNFSFHRPGLRPEKRSEQPEEAAELIYSPTREQNSTTKQPNLQKFTRDERAAQIPPTRRRVLPEKWNEQKTRFLDF